MKMIQLFMAVYLQNKRLCRQKSTFFLFRSYFNRNGFMFVYTLKSFIIPGLSDSARGR